MIARCIARSVSRCFGLDALYTAQAATDGGQILGVRGDGQWNYRGYQATVLDSPWLQVVVLQDKGCDIYRCIYKPLDLDILWQTAWGLTPRGQAAPGSKEFYEGGWQVMFPLQSSPALWGTPTALASGNASNQPWRLLNIHTSAEAVQASFELQLISRPFTLRRHISLRRSEGTLGVYTTVQNRSPQPLPGTFGEHLAFGAPFVIPGDTAIRIPQASVTAHGPEFPAPRRADAGAQSIWPSAIQHDTGRPMTLSRLPPRGTPGDLFHLERLQEGQYALMSDYWNCRIDVRWNLSAMPQLWYWQEFGQGRAPWYGQHYNIGLFPVSTPDTASEPSPLPDADRSRRTLWWAPHETKSFALRLNVSHGHFHHR